MCNGKPQPKVVLVVVTGSSPKLSLESNWSCSLKFFFCLEIREEEEEGRKRRRHDFWLPSSATAPPSTPSLLIFFLLVHTFRKSGKQHGITFFRGKKTLKTWLDGSSDYSVHYLSEQSQYKKTWLCGNGLGWNQIGPSSSPLKEKIVSLQIATSFSILNSYWYFAQTSVSPMSSSTIWSL